MFDWADYISEQYEDYMAQNCTCDRNGEECICLTFEEFENTHLKDLQDEWGEIAWRAQQEKIEFQI